MRTSPLFTSDFLQPSQIIANNCTANAQNIFRNIKILLGSIRTYADRRVPDPQSYTRICIVHLRVNIWCNCLFNGQYIYSLDFVDAHAYSELMWTVFSYQL